MDDPIPKLKTQLHAELMKLVGHYNQHVVASRLGISQPRMSKLIRGQLDSFSLEMLIRLLARIDRPVELRVPSLGPPVMFFSRKARGGRGGLTPRPHARSPTAVSAALP